MFIIDYKGMPFSVSGSNFNWEVKIIVFEL